MARFQGPRLRSVELVSSMTKGVTFVASLYNDGSKERGLSYEYYNLFKPLEQVAGVVDTFDFMQTARDLGKARMNQSLIEIVKRDRPAVLMVVPFRDEFDPA